MAGGGGGHRHRPELSDRQPYADGADLKQVREEMEYWAGKLAEAEAEDKHGGRNRAYRAVARDV